MNELKNNQNNSNYQKNEKGQFIKTTIEIWKLKDKNKTPTQISNKLNLTIHQVNHRWKGFNKTIDVNSGRLL